MMLARGPATIISAALLLSRRALFVSAFSTESKIAAATSQSGEKRHVAKRVAIVGAGVSDVVFIQLLTMIHPCIDIT